MGAGRNGEAAWADVRPRLQAATAKKERRAVGLEFVLVMVRGVYE